jgi:hypothetical protein
VVRNDSSATIRLVRRHLAWPLAVPLSILGVLAAHWLAYRLVVPDPHARSHVLAASGHGYLTYAPLAVGVSAALIALAFVSAVIREVRGGHPGVGAPAWLVGLLPPLAFAAQEYLERYAQHGAVEWGVALEPTFVVGLALQAPFALLAVLGAVVLACAARRVAAILGRRAPRPATRGLTASRLPLALDVPRASIVALGYAGRAPPSGL